MEPPIKKATTSISSERDNIDKLTKENRALKQKVDNLEKENRSLKKSIYDLTVKYTAAAAAHQQRISPFMIDFEEPQEGGGKEINLGNSTDIYDVPEQIDSVDNVFSYEKDKLLEASLLLATGSADPYAYLFNVGSPEGTGELLQRLEGHTDFVYAVDFHPFEPILASCSADFTIKIWVPNAR
ncbi:11782_t:CDS:2, partial [Racocetra fulgida]